MAHIRRIMLVNSAGQLIRRVSHVHELTGSQVAARVWWGGLPGVEGMAASKRLLYQSGIPLGNSSRRRSSASGPRSSSSCSSGLEI